MSITLWICRIFGHIPIHDHDEELFFCPRCQRIWNDWSPAP